MHVLKRSFIKTLTYRAICTTETFLVTWLVTGNWKAGGVIAFILIFTKIGTYFGHEMLWHWLARTRLEWENGK